MPVRWPSIERNLFILRRRPSVRSNCIQEFHFTIEYGRPLAQWFGKARGQQAHSRRASTTPSVTAVNAKRAIPEQFQALYASLKALERDAGVFVNSSQLQLALRGVESEDAVTRVAVLVLNGKSGARRLTRALLADPLAGEQLWERQILSSDENDGRAILLRYNENPGVDERHPLLRTFSIPSSTLHTHKLEILIHTIRPSPQISEEYAAGLLVPGLDITSSASGRFSTVTYPVHKALIYEEGLSSFATFATMEYQTMQYQTSQMLKGAIDWSWNTVQQRNNKEQLVLPINLALAETAIETLRKSLNSSLEYEHMWFDAGMPTLSTWLVEGTEVDGESIKSNVKRLIQTLCESGSRKIQVEAATKLQEEKDAVIPFTTQNIINQGITIWAENAHTELRDRLDSAFASKGWRKTKWWKLFWRVDDVGYVATDILQRAWLVDAEKEFIWICGRIHQSGLLGPPNLRPIPVKDPDDDEQKLGGRPPAPSLADLVPPGSSFNEQQPIQHPWPQDISRARSTLTSLTIPPLQALSQTLLLQTLSTNVLASSFAALIYVSISTTSLYESGAVVATGLVYSLRRLQKRWEAARQGWEAQAREEGRRVLRSAEGLAREAVQDYKPEVDEVGVQERAIAARAVENVKKASEALE